VTESPFEFTDKRRIDPETGEPREANAETPADADADVDIQVPDDASSLVADEELTFDPQPRPESAQGEDTLGEPRPEDKN